MPTTIDAQTLKLLRPLIEQELAELMKKHGLACKVTRGTYGGETGSFKLELCVPDASGESDPALIRAARDFPTYARLYGLKPTDLGRVVTINARPCKIIGLMPSRPKYPIVVRKEGETDVTLYQSEAVVKAIARADAAAATPAAV